MQSRAAALVGLLVAVCVAAALFFEYFTGRPHYDDEGYMIVSLNGVATGHRLYTDVFSQYGPAFFLFLALPLRLVGLEWTIEAARFATVAIMLGTGVLMAWTVRRITGANAFAIAAAVALLGLASGAEAALHPTHLLLLLVAVALVGVTVLDTEPRSRLGLALAGGAVGLAVLVKLNVGVLLAVAVVFGVGDFRWTLLAGLRRYLPLAVALALGGFALLGGDATTYLAALIVPAVLFTITMRRARSEPVAIPITGLIAAGVVAALACVAIFLVLGSSPAALLRGVVLDPARQADSFAFSVPIGRVTLVGLLVAGGLALASLRGAGLRPEVRVAVALVIIGRVALHDRLGTVLLGVHHRLPSVVWFDALLVSAALCACIAPTARVAGLASARTLAALCVTLPLMAFPVAGGQIEASLIVLPAFAFVVIADAIDELRSRGRTHLGRLELTATARAAALLVAMLLVGVALVDGARGWRRESPIPGAELVRAEPSNAEAVASVTDALQRECASFYSLPGFNSFYLLADLEPPTQRNATTWMTLFDADLQAAVVRDLKRTENLCVVRNWEYERFWLDQGTERLGPLRGFLDQADELVVRVYEYEVFRFGS